MRETSGSGRTTPVQHRRGRALRAALIAAAILVTALLGSFMTWVILGPRAPAPARGPARFPIALPADYSLIESGVAISPDGSRIAFVAERNGVSQLFLRSIDSLDAVPIAGTENAQGPFFSPDGQRLGFFAGTIDRNIQLKAVALAGGAPVPLADVIVPRGATWAPGDTIIYSPATDAGLWQVAATGGGTPRELTRPDPAKGERSYRWPHVVPGGEAVIFTLATSDIQSFDDGRLVVRSLRTGEQRELIRGGTWGVCAATGHLLFARGGALMAVPFDVPRLAVAGSPKPVLDGLVTYPFSGVALYAIAGDGTLVYVAGHSVSRQANLKWVDRTGKSTVLAAPPAAYQGISIAPSGREVALDLDGANGSIWLLDLERTNPTRMTAEWSNNFPLWTPDGARVVFISGRGGARQLFWQTPDGRGHPEPLTSARPSHASIGSWTPDGRTLLFGELSRGTGWDILALPVAGGRGPEAFLQTPFNEQHPKVSPDPDGRWVAYTSDESGRTEVYVMSYDKTGRKRPISTEGGTWPVWARDGRELFYKNGDAMMGVKIETSPSFSAGSPQLLFRQLSARGSQGSRDYTFDVAADGRFLMIEDLPSTPLRTATVVMNWNGELRRRLSAER
jgi:serine/threonine-protein kinase